MIGPSAQYHGDEWMSEHLKKLGSLCSLHEVYGLLHGCMAAPQMTMPSRYIDFIFSENGANYETEAEANEFISNLMALWNRLAQWNPETEPFLKPAPLYPDTPQGLKERARQYGSLITHFMKGLDLGRTQESDFTKDALNALKKTSELQAMFEKYMELPESDDTSKTLTLIGKFERVMDDCLARINIGLKPARMRAVEEMQRSASKKKGSKSARSDKTGRNEPCPCGSGKKYKKCCLGREEFSQPASGSSGVIDEIHQRLEEQEFSSLEETRAFTETLTSQQNRIPRDELCGLSPDEIFRIFCHPFSSPQLLTFPDPIAILPQAPILSLFTLLTSAIGEKGLKQTAKGNLPRNFCREAALSHWGEEVYLTRTRSGGINRELDFFDLHITRIAAELAGLIRKYRGRFILSRTCKKLLAGAGLAGIYPLLFRAYVKEFNWGYWDYYPDYYFFQHTFAFTLYLLVRYGDSWRPQVFYEDCFLRAFPQALDEAEPPPTYCTPEERIRSAYTLRTLLRFAPFFGLAVLEPTTDDSFGQQHRLRKLPLLDEVVRFHPQGEQI